MTARLFAVKQGEGEDEQGRLFTLYHVTRRGTLYGYVRRYPVPGLRHSVFHALGLDNRPLGEELPSLDVAKAAVGAAYRRAQENPQTPRGRRLLDI